MKKATKILALLLCAVLLVVGSVAGTLAYLTSQDDVTNTFTVGNVKITLDETDVDNSETDNEDCEEGRDRQNDYHLLPGKEYDKDPIVRVDADSEKCWIFVKIVNEIAAIEDSANTVAAQMDDYGWDLIDANNGIYAYEEVVEAGDDIPVFDGFKIADTVTNTQLAEYDGKTIVVTAYAVQEEGFESATKAWEDAGSALLTQG